MVTRLLDENDYVLAQWTLLGYVFDAAISSYQIALWYYWRWLIELDIRAIKCSLGMDILRAKTPASGLHRLFHHMHDRNLIRRKHFHRSHPSQLSDPFNAPSRHSAFSASRRI